MSVSSDFSEQSPPHGLFIDEADTILIEKANGDINRLERGTR